MKKVNVSWPVHEFPAVVQPHENDVQHQRDVDAPVHAVAVEVEAVDDEVGDQDHGQVAPVTKSKCFYKTLKRLAFFMAVLKG